MPARLLVMAPSHYSEKARWALDRLGVPYAETCVAPGFQFLSLARVGGRSMPTLVLESGEVLKDSTDILKHLDAGAPGDAKLFGEDAARAEVEKLEDELDETLGPLVRDWIYSWVLDDAQLVRRMFDRDLPGYQSTLMKTLGGAFAFGTRQRLGLKRGEGEQRFEQLLRYVRTLDERYPGGAYLVSDRFSAADLTLASLGAHAVAAPEYGGSTIPLELRPERARQQLPKIAAQQEGRRHGEKGRQH
ncbi:MAG: glutathione S-transferase family protein, partial [Myxococcales bacterium]